MHDWGRVRKLAGVAAGLALAIAYLALGLFLETTDSAIVNGPDGRPPYLRQ